MNDIDIAIDIALEFDCVPDISQLDDITQYLNYNKDQIIKIIEQYQGYSYDNLVQMKLRKSI